MRNEKGSILILAIITILIMSIMAIAGLTISSLEIDTTKNFYHTKTAFYKAVEAAERIRMEIYQDSDPVTVTNINYNKTGTQEYTDGAMGYTDYITGTLTDYFNNSSINIDVYNGFNAPPLKGMSLGGRTGASPVIWYVPVTAHYRVGGSDSYAEIITGVYSIITTKH